jgi:hypothetical protein
MRFTIGDFTTHLPTRPRRPWCDGKQAHKSQGAAEAHIRALARRGRDVSQFNIYYCATCLKFHLGRHGRADAD